jgi:putative PIN family toxin of toxin-antitoxin system
LCVRVVVDTNVVVAGFRSRRGASFRLLTLLGAGKFEIAVSVPLVLEYEAVLRVHAGDLSLSTEDVTGLVEYLSGAARRQAIHFLWRPTLRDPVDEFVLELAVAAECDAVVMHDVRDFAGARTFGVKMMTPAAFVRLLEERP